MSKKDLILDPSEYDVNTVVADIEEIRRYNPQRFEMEQLSAICYEDPTRNICVGYKDLGPNEFWIRGHMPGVPIMPGVVMCESVAQLASYCARKFKLMNAEMIGFGGLKDVRFRGIVRPGERFVVVVSLVRARSAMLLAQFQCFVRGDMVCDGLLRGIPLPENVIKNRQA
ncbi:MAG: beta-hydroxyacyl-ACP dehydratase [Pirellulales bacterium]|nr:beta-hydroxyacyl-ACP dehydratase [Pirellulales bacterium]